MKILSQSDILSYLQSRSQKASLGYQSQYYAMYSSWFCGIVTDPSLMMIPVDDHLVHRGDGVFEAIKIVNGKIWLFDEHLDRLVRSATRLEFPADTLSTEFKSTLKNIIIETSQVALKVSQATKESFNAIIRLYLSRGPGSFGTNPADSVGPQIYCVVTKISPPSAEKFEKGVMIGKSQIPVKPDWFSQVKSCNYLQNVLMKKESVDRKLDFTIAFTQDAMVAEGSTENICIINKMGQLVHPRLDYILKGTTMTKLFDLVESAGLMSVVRGTEITEVSLLNCQGAFMVGTTLDVIPVCSYESKTLPISTYAKKFLELLHEDQAKGVSL